VVSELYGRVERSGNVDSRPGGGKAPPANPPARVFAFIREFGMVRRGSAGVTDILPNVP